MNKPQTAKIIVRYTTAFAIGRTVGSIIRSNVPRSENAVINVAVDISCLVTALAVTGMAQDAVGAHTDKKIDEITAFVQQFNN